MDKQFVFILLCFFAVCAGFITYFTVNTPKRSRLHGIIAKAYVSLIWAFILALTYFTIVY